MKKITGDKPVGIIIHTYMEISQGNSLCSYLYLKQAKMSCFSFDLFSFFLLQNRRTGGQNKSYPREKAVTSGRREVLRKEVNMVQKMCTHVCKCKNDTY
jgi:hypothetical protein